MVEAGKLYKIVALSGSLREASTNTAALRYVQELAPKDRIASVEILTYKDVPVYDGDVEAIGIPDTVKAIGEKIAEADAVYISTPEYNFSISAALKNILDWLSRLSSLPLKDKPVAIMSVSAGPSGGLRAQYDLRKVLLMLRCHVIITPEVSIPANYLKFAKEGKLNDESALKYIETQVKAFPAWIDFVKKGLA